jgi:ribonuclease/clavin/mitogillin
MIGLSMPDVDHWSDRVVVALGQNPSVFTGPGTNTYLVGTGDRRILLDTGSGSPAYLPVLEQGLEAAGCEGLQEIVLTHGHPDHIGGVAEIRERFGKLRVSKFPWPEVDARVDGELRLLEDGDTVETEGATLRAIHTPGHCTDHLCFLLEEERSLFSGDNILGVGTTVIPPRGGSLREYLSSLRRVLDENPGVIYPAHGPRIDDGPGKIREYIAHREEREKQILEAMGDEATTIAAIVRVVYARYPESLHAAAGQSVCSHLLKLEEEGRATRTGGSEALTDRWTRV